jgi:uncharacterized Fe-S cluster protein YjdI
MHEYKNKDITVNWDAKKCIHSAVCINSLPEVFNLKEKPWVNVDQADKEAIMKTIDKCPSGALSYKIQEVSVEVNKDKSEIKFMKNGPILMKGAYTILHNDGTETVKEGSFSLCRCGASSKKPFCDGTHKSTGFSAP